MKLKISNITWAILPIGIVLVLLAGVGMAYGIEKEQQKRLNQELNQAQLRLANYSNGTAALRAQVESQLADVEKKIQSTKNSLGQSIESSKITDTLFNAADSSSVEIIEIGQSEMSFKKIEGIEFYVIPLKVMVEGDVGNLISYVSKLSQEFSTDTIESINIDTPRPPPESTEGGEGEIKVKKPSARISLAIHIYKGG